MTLVLNSVQFFAIGIFLGAVFGFFQGFQRTLIVTGFALAAILLLYIGSANGIAQVLFVRVPQTINILSGGAFFSTSPAPPSANQVLISALVTLVLFAFIGYRIARWMFKPIDVSGGPIKFRLVGHPRDYFFGIIPGMVMGYAVVFYLGHLFSANPTISVGATTPSPNSLGNYIVILVVIAIVAIIIGLLMARFGKPAGK
jgi:hypothetical protein